jgi:hypothetical protein
MVEKVSKDRTRRWSEMLLKTRREDGGGGRKGQERRRSKMWLKTGREMVEEVGKDRREEKMAENVVKDRTRDSRGEVGKYRIEDGKRCG